MRIVNILALATLLSPVCLLAASKEQQEMQRDIAQLQDQVRTLQSGFDQKMQRAELEFLISSRAAMTALAENYVGLPY